MGKEWATKSDAGARIAFLIGSLLGGSAFTGLVEAASGPPPESPTHQEILRQIDKLSQQIDTLQGLITQIPTATHKRYFLSTGTTDGDIATDFCGSGFHMASLWEIFTDRSPKV